MRESKDLKFGNDVFHVKFDKAEFPPFGAKYDFHLEGVVDCPEFLVNFDVLKELAAEFDLTLVYRKRFEEFFSQYKDDEEGKTLLIRMQALEVCTDSREQCPGCLLTLFLCAILNRHTHPFGA